MAARPWVIRVASAPEDGGGHVQRCRALGLALLRHSPVVMVLDAGGEAWRSRLEAEGFRVALEGADLTGPWQGSVLDGYRFSRTTIQWLLAKAAPLAVIDDFLAPPLGAALVINPAPALDGEAINGIPALLGPQYALLDERFQNLSVIPIKTAVEHVLVAFGMADQGNATVFTLDALRQVRKRGFGFRITVVLGATAPHLNDVRSRCREVGQAELQLDVGDMASLIRAADLVIGAGGVSLLERMACGVPSVTIALTENQRLPSEGAGRLGATVYAGRIEELTATTLAARIRDLAGDQAARSAIASRGRTHVDGRGAERVAEVLLRLSRRGAPVPSSVS